MEERILLQVNKAISEAIQSELVGYNKPLSKIVERVLGDNEQEIYNIVNGEVTSLLRADGFKQALCDAMHKKMAKSLIARMGGEIEKQVNSLNQNPQTRARLTLAIDEIITNL